MVNIDQLISLKTCTIKERIQGRNFRLGRSVIFIEVKRDLLDWLFLAEKRLHDRFQGLFAIVEIQRGFY
jgi:hypothetical protein